MEAKAVRLIGLARRAGCVVTGDNAVKASIKRNDCYLIVLARDVSENLFKKYEFITSEAGIKLIRISTKDALGEVLGVGDIAVIGITCRDFTRGITEALGK